jgi:murein DD-endopeptidase MepM/ murein hydrolase activator NlpD
MLSCVDFADAKIRKGMASLVVLTIVLAILFGVAFFFRITHLSKWAKMRGEVEMYMEFDDRGTEILSFLQSKKEGITYIEMIKILNAKNVPEDLREKLRKHIESTLDNIEKAGKNYYFVARDFLKKVIYEKRSGVYSAVGEFYSDLSLEWPVDQKKKVISSGFGWRTRKIPDFHGGIDIPAKTGTPVLSATDGEVTKVDKTGGGALGKFIKIEILGHPDLQLVYGHLSKVFVEEGQKVEAGQKIGEVGATGLREGPHAITAPHLHFEMRKSPFIADKDSVNVCPYLINSPKNCNQYCTVFEDRSICGEVFPSVSSVTPEIVESRADIPLPGGKRGSIELILWG